MSDLKSKLPDLHELMSMGGKLFNGVKNAVNEIVDDYKKKRAAVADSTPKDYSEENQADKVEKKPAKKKAASEKKPAAKEGKKD